MFPGGLAGVALFILRVSVIAGLALGSTHPLSNAGGWQHYLAWITAIVVLFGAPTPVGCSMCLLLESCSLRMDSTAAETLLHMLTTVVLLLLGPGSYSVDAVLFGRRRIIPPHG